MVVRTVTEPMVLNYRGARDYVHGNSLFSAILGVIPDPSDIVFKVNRRLTCNSVQVVEFDNASEAKRFPCVCTASTGGRIARFAIVEAGADDGGCRESYDEASVISSAIFDRNTAILGMPNGVRFIDSAVALNKALLLRCHPLDSTAQYVFARIDLDKVYEDYSPLKIVLADSVGESIFVSDIYVKDFSVGKIYFSIWRKKS